MEVLLNSLWAFLALAALVAWVRYARRAPAVDARCFIALLCVLVLMFPVISASDDLHPVSELSDDATRRQHAPMLGPHVVASLAVAPIVSLMILLSGPLSTLALPVVNANPGYFRLNAGRAPPEQLVVAGI
jgi:hypothetical protein